MVSKRKILLIDGGKATPLSKTEFTEEGKLQDYLEEHPTLIPLADVVEGASDLICIGREELMLGHPTARQSAPNLLTSHASHDYMLCKV